MRKVLKLALFPLITVLAACGQFSIAVSPAQVSLKSGAQQQFLVSELNAQNPNGSWSSTCGSIDGSGMFTAPLVTADQLCSVAFTDLENAAFAFASVSIISLVDGPATLPFSVPSSSMASTPAPGALTQVPPGGLQTALNAAHCGDTLELAGGGSYAGSFTLPAKACDDGHWIVIRTSAPDSALPAEGSRINPCYAGVTSLPGRPPFACPAASAGVLAKIITPASLPAFIPSAGATHYRLGPGLEITRAAGSGVNYGLIIPSAAADHIVIDRDWIHGTSQDDTTRGVLLSGVVYAAVVDSYLNDFHCTAGIGACSDAQTISGGTGPLAQGNWKIAGNFLEASTENILFGGVLKNSATPTDITIVNNHLFKPLIWMPGQPGFVGGKESATATCKGWDPTGTIGQCPFVVKNLFELKNAQRVLFEGNVLEYTWPGFTQHGHAILLSGLNPPGQYSTISLADVTLRYNRVAHATAGLVIANMATEGVPNLPVSRISVHDDVLDDLSPAYSNGDNSIAAAMPFQLNSCSSCVPLSDISINHVTMLLQAPKIGLILGATWPALLSGIQFTNNIVSFVPNLAVTGVGPSGPCGFTGATNLLRLNSCFAAPYSFAGNLLIGASNIWPTGNYLPTNPTAVMFEKYQNANGGDYHLLPVSPYASAGTDGKDPGADVSTVDRATASVE